MKAELENYHSELRHSRAQLANVLNELMEHCKEMRMLGNDS